VCGNTEFDDEITVVFLFFEVLKSGDVMVPVQLRLILGEIVRVRFAEFSAQIIVRWIAD
jgi:hypothetical protein